MSNKKDVLDVGKNQVLVKSYSALHVNIQNESKKKINRDIYKIAEHSCDVKVTIDSQSKEFSYTEFAKRLGMKWEWD